MRRNMIFLYPGVYPTVSSKPSNPIHIQLYKKKKKK